VKKHTDDAGHKFKVGEIVFYTSGVGSSRRSDVFTIMQRLPAGGGTTDVASRALTSHLIELSRKPNSKRRCDLYGVRLRLTCRVVYAKSKGYQAARDAPLPSLRHGCRGYPVRAHSAGLDLPQGPAAPFSALRKRVFTGISDIRRVGW
jgi:hypothetical protein